MDRAKHVPVSESVCATLRRLLSEATARPWRAQWHDPDATRDSVATYNSRRWWSVDRASGLVGQVLRVMSTAHGRASANAELVATAVNHLLALLDVADAAQAFKAANRLVRALSIAEVLPGTELPGGVSLGEAVDRQQETVEALFRALARLDPERVR